MIRGFLRVRGIRGGSHQVGHEDEIEVHAVEFRMQAPFDAAGGRRGRVVLEPIVFRKHYDAASPHLQRALFSNAGLGEVVFTSVRNLEGEVVDDLVITLTEAFVVDFELRPAEDAPDLLDERVALAYQAISFRLGDNEVQMDPGRGV